MSIRGIATIAPNVNSPKPIPIKNTKPKNFNTVLKLFREN